MKNKKFTMLNDVGIEVNYTVLAILTNENDMYAIYTNFMPSDNELGYRLLVGKVICEEPFKLERVNKEMHDQMIDSFLNEIIESR